MENSRDDDRIICVGNIAMTSKDMSDFVKAFRNSIKIYEDKKGDVEGSDRSFHEILMEIFGCCFNLFDYFNETDIVNDERVYREALEESSLLIMNSIILNTKLSNFSS